MFGTLSTSAAYSTAALVPWNLPSGSNGGTRLATLRMMKRSPGAASKIAETSTRASQQAMTMAVGDWPRAASWP